MTACRCPGFAVGMLIALDPIVSGHPADLKLPVAVSSICEPCIASLMHQIQEVLGWLGTATSQGLYNRLVVQPDGGHAGCTLPVDQFSC